MYSLLRNSTNNKVFLWLRLPLARARHRLLWRSFIPKTCFLEDWVQHGATWYNISAEHLANQQRFHQPIDRSPSVTPIHQATVIMRHPWHCWMVIGCPCTRQASVGPHGIFVAPALERPILAEGVAVVQIGAVLLVLFWAGGWIELGVGGGKMWVGMFVHVTDEDVEALGGSMNKPPVFWRSISLNRIQHSDYC